MSDIQTVIVSASHRPESQSRRITDLLNQRHLNNNASVLDLYQAHLPLWDSQTEATEAVEHCRTTLQQADAIVLVIPEWHGMVPAGLKNLLLWCGAPQLAHKPVLLVGVSAGDGASMIMAEMRAGAYKNTRMNFIPENLILRDASNLWQGHNSESDTYLEQRAKMAFQQLNLYAQALKPVREELTASLEDYPNGMS